MRAILEAGIDAAAIEYLDNATMALAGGACPADVDATGTFAVLAEVDGDEEDGAARPRRAARGAQRRARDLRARRDDSGGRAVRALWRWRAGIPYAVQAPRGGKLSEDIVVPLDRLEEAIDGTLQIGARHGLAACSWGHAGDGNLHSTMLARPSRPR